MAKIVLTNPVVYINGVNLSDHITQLSIDQTWAEVDTTAFGDAAVRRVAGLGDNSVSIDFQQDFAATSVDQTINPLVGSTAPVQVWASGSATSSTNPKYTFNVLVNEWHPIGGAVGDLAMASVTWPCDGTVARATA